MACPVMWGHLAWPAPTGAQSDPVPTLEEGYMHLLQLPQSEGLGGLV